MNLNKQDRRTSAPAYLWDNFNFESLKQVLRPRDNPIIETQNFGETGNKSGPIKDI